MYIITSVLLYPLYSDSRAVTWDAFSDETTPKYKIFMKRERALFSKFVRVIEWDENIDG